MRLLSKYLLILIAIAISTVAYADTFVDHKTPTDEELFWIQQDKEANIFSDRNIFISSSDTKDEMQNKQKLSNLNAKVEKAVQNFLSICSGLHLKRLRTAFNAI